MYEGRCKEEIVDQLILTLCYMRHYNLSIYEESFHDIPAHNKHYLVTFCTMLVNLRRVQVAVRLNLAAIPLMPVCFLKMQ